MAAGVRADLEEVERVLSHWVTVLRFCNPLLPGDICYRNFNMKDLFARWFPPELIAPPPLRTCDRALQPTPRQLELPRSEDPTRPNKATRPFA